jgi:hypothetical protein
MTEIELSCEAFEEIRDKCVAAGLIADEPREWDEDAKPFTVGGITFKEWKYVPTPEDIARREEYRKTPLGQLMAQTFESNAAKLLASLSAPNYFLDHLSGELDKTLDAKIGTTLRIRLPSDYAKS